MSGEIFYENIDKLDAMLDSRQISAVELATVFIDRKNAVDSKEIGRASCRERV